MIFAIISKNSFNFLNLERFLLCIDTNAMKGV